MESSIRGRVPAGTRLIETFGWMPGKGFVRLDMHLARMETSARQLGFAYDDAAARACLKADGTEPLRCRLTLDESGFDFTSTPMGPTPTNWKVRVSEVQLHSKNMWLQHKTTQRAVYDTARAALPEGVDELLFHNEKGEFCEGTITNLFVTLENGQQITPPLACGLLPGVLRQALINSGQVVEAEITRDTLQAARAIHMGNSLRGLIPATLI